MSSRWIKAFALLTLLVGCGKEGPTGPVGPSGPTGPAGPGFTSGPSISGVSPSQVVVNAEYDIVIEGFATDWTNAAVPSFGDGITVVTTVAASSTSLLVHIKVTPTAPVDIHDVSVVQGTATTHWKNAFRVLPESLFTAFGTASPLSASVVRLEVNDPTFEFDSSSDFGDFSGVTVTASNNFPVQVLSLSRQVLDVLVLADIDAGVGAYDLNVVSRPGTFAERTFTAPQIISIVAGGDPTPFSGGPVSETVTKAFQSTSYLYTPDVADGGQATVVVQVTSSTPGITPRVAVIPASSGLWADSSGFSASTTLNPFQGDAYDFVVWESSGATGFSYTLTATSLVAVPEEEPDDTVGDAHPLTVPGLAEAQFSSLTDVDFFKITAAPGDVGKHFHVVTLGGDFVDTLVEIIKPDGTTSFGISDDQSTEENYLSPAIPTAGDYYLKVSYSPYITTYDVNDSHYEVLVTIE